MERRSRYPGTRPYSDSEEDRRLFFGRSEDTEQLFLRVLSVPLLVLFGRSGLGKTSLLRAGLFPRLRSKEYLPVAVRLNTPGEPLAAVAARAIDRACEQEGLEPPRATAPDLKTLLARVIIWREDLLLTPVLVLDQFEEVFTLHDSESRQRIATEIGALLFNSGMAGEQQSGTAASFPFKLIISLREDFVGALEEMTAQIPNLFQERMRVRPFGEAAAREAITGPAALEDRAGAPFTVAPFAYAPELLDQMLDYLRGSFGVIEPFQLQLLCRRAEETAERLQRSAEGRVTLVPGSFGSEFRYEHVLRDFYRDVLGELPRLQRRRAARLCEEGLLDRGGHRLMLEATQNRAGLRGPSSDPHLAHPGARAPPGAETRERLLRNRTRPTGRVHRPDPPVPGPPQVPEGALDGGGGGPAASGSLVLPHRQNRDGEAARGAGAEQLRAAAPVPGLRGFSDHHRRPWGERDAGAGP